jgi:hypothetical protein
VGRGKPCPKELIQKIECDKGKSCTGKGKSTVCGAVTDPISKTGKTHWKLFMGDEIDPKNPGHIKGVKHTHAYMDVDTSHCNFKRMPAYVSNLQVPLPLLTEPVAVLSYSRATKTGFRVHVWHPKMNGYQLLDQYDLIQRWQVTWLGDTGTHLLLHLTTPCHAAPMPSPAGSTIYLPCRFELCPYCQRQDRVEVCRQAQCDPDGGERWLSSLC